MPLAGVRPSDIRIVVFDMFGTLVRNEIDDWTASVGQVVRDQGLPISAEALYREWSAREVEFRKSRTNVRDPASSPPFQSYESAWREAFVTTFAALGIAGDAEAAARSCGDAHATRLPFADTAPALAELAAHTRLGVLSNADDRFLEGLIANQGWAFEPVLSSESARAYKPDPRIFAAFCELAGVEPRHVLYVGDSAYDDAHGAKLAGMQAVHLRRDQQTPGRTPTPAGVELLPPDHVIETLVELGPLLGLGAATREGERA